MTDVLKLSDSVTSLDLMYDSAPGFQLLASGLKFATPEHENLYHSSEWQDGEQLARHKLENRNWPLKLALKSNDSDDNIANELIKLNRLVRQARRYWLEGDVDKVYLEIQLDGATNYTRYACVDVQVQSTDIFSFFNRKSGDVKFDGGIGLEVITQPWGYGAEVTLANSLGTPHFEEDEDSDGLADQWTESGTPTTTLDTTVYLVGSQSQKVVTDAAGTDGIYSDTVTVSGVDNIASYAWLFCTSGSDEVTLDVQADSTGSIGTATYSAATETDTGANSNTWKRLDVIGSTTASDTTLTMRVERLTGDASEATTYYVDKTYLQLDATAVPTGWMSCRHLYNHTDGNAGHISYFDVLDIPGDLPGGAGLRVTNTDASDRYYETFVATKSFFDNRFADWTPTFNADDMTVDSGSLNDRADSPGTGGTAGIGRECYIQGTGFHILGYWDITDTLAYTGNYSVLARCRTSTGSVKIRFAMSTYTVAAGTLDTDYYGEYVTVPTTAQTKLPWTHLGIAPIPWFAVPESTDWGTIRFYLQVNLIGSSRTAAAYDVLLLPSEFTTIARGKATAANQHIYPDDWIQVSDSDGNAQLLFYDSSITSYASYFEHIGGQPSWLYPGTYHRGVIATDYYETEKRSDILHPVKLTIIYRPRTEFLLGTD